jgi:hypothetical protein
MMEMHPTKDATGNKLWLVYIDTRFVGHVQPVRGGWVFFDSNGDVTAADTTLEGAARLGVDLV